MPPRRRQVVRRIPEGLFNDTPARRGNQALRNVNIRNDTRLTANRREFRNLTPEQLLERQTEFYTLRDRGRDERDRDIQIDLRNRFRQEFQGLPVASVFFDHNDGRRARPYDEQLNFNENQHWLFARLLSGNLRPEVTRTFNNPPVRNGRYRIEIEYIGDDGNDRTRVIELTIPNFNTYLEIERYVNNTPELYWSTREDSDQLMDIRSVRVFPVMQWTGGRNPRLNRLLDGPAHCFFAPIIRFYQNKIEKGIRVKNYKTGVRKCEKLIEKYKDGVSKEDFEEISKTLSATFDIVDITGKTIWTNVKSGTRADNTFKFIYSDYEHVNVDKCETVLSMIEDIIEKGNFDSSVHEVGTRGKLCKYLIGKQVQEISENSMQDIFEFLKHNKLYFSFTSNSTKNIKSITTNGVKFILQKTKADTLREEFMDSIKDFKFNYHVSNPTYELVRTCYVQKVQFAYQKSPDNIEGLQEFDMIKAYTNSHVCPYYVEFPTILNHMVNFDEDEEIDTYEFVKSHVGFYQVSVLSTTSDPKLLAHLARFGIEAGTSHMYCFTSPMIMWLIDKFECDIKLYIGTWSEKTKDIRFSDEIKNTKTPEGISLYAQIVGLMASEPETINTYYYVNEDFTQEVSALVEGSKFDYTPYLYDCGKSYGELKLEIPKTAKSMLNHLPIASFVLQYTFINVFSEVIKFDAEDIFAVKVDSILLKEGHTIMNSLFRKKDPKLLNSPIFEGYFQKVNNFNIHQLFMDTDMPIEEEFVIGQGGSGKTYHFIDDISTIHYKYLNPLYVSPSNKLKQYKAAEFEKRKPDRLKIISQNKFQSFCLQNDYFMEFFEEMYKHTEAATLKTCTVAKLIGKRCDSYRKELNLFPGCIIIDESTMLSEGDYSKIKEMYPYCKTYFLGDFSTNLKLISYQAIIDDGKVVVLSLKDRPYYEFEGDRRSEKGDKLIEFKTLIRQMMDSGVTKGIQKLISSFNCRTIMLEDLPSHYKDDDICIAHHDKMCIKVDEVLKDKRPMYRILESLPEKNLYRGDIVFDVNDIDPSAYELRRCFTSHSIQGETIEPGRTVYIMIRDLLGEKLLRTFYTAVSRVRRLDQIVFVYDTRMLGVKSKREEVQEVTHEVVKFPDLHLEDEYAPISSENRNDWMKNLKPPVSKSWY